MPRTGLLPSEIKEQAIKIAEERITRNGFEKVRLVDIAHDMSISHVALYKHFPDKAALIDSVSQKWLIDIDAKLQVTADSDLPIKERIYAWFLEYHRHKRNKVLLDPEGFKAFTSAVSGDKPFVFEHLDRIRSQTRQLVAAAMAEKLIAPADPHNAAATLLETTIAYHHPKIVAERIGEDREQSLVRLLDVVLAGLK